MLEPWREEAIAHSTGAHSPSAQGGQGHLTHQGPVYFSLLSGATLCASTAAYTYAYACTLISAILHFFSWWFLCTTPACKCLNHRSGVRPYIQQHRAFHISLHLHPSALLDPRYVIPGGPTPVFLRCLLDNSIPGRLDWQHNQPEVSTHRLSLRTFSNGTASPPTSLRMEGV